MSLLHICNSFFEFELEATSQKSLWDWFTTHEAVLQLQFLPILYAGPNDRILVNTYPASPDPRLSKEIAPHPNTSIDAWGHSLAIANWAKKHNISYFMPEWSIVQKVNSKEFSFSRSPKLPFAELLATKSEVAAWIEATPGPKVLKTPFGTAGNGHFHISSHRNLDAFLSQHLPKRPLIGEPWVERIFDFSTQWKIGDQIDYLGATIFENLPNGTYLATYAGKPFADFAWALEEHLAIAKPLLAKIQSMGFFGHLGIDAYIYTWEGKHKCQPIVEINGRKTMSWAALAIQQKHSRPLRLSFERGSQGALPAEITLNGKQILFSRQLTLTNL